MQGLLTAVCAALEWPCEDDAPRMQLALAQSLRYKPHGVSSGGNMMREASAWGNFNDLNETVRESVRSTAECDRNMYNEAILRMGLTPPGKLGEKLSPSLCAAAKFVRPELAAQAAPAVKGGLPQAAQK